jgi:FixJ family two-component response regulator
MKPADAVFDVLSASGGGHMTVSALKILLVEDNELFAQSTMRMLHGVSAEVHWVARANDALARARPRAYDVILLDLVLPDLGGPPLIARLCEIDPRCPIIVMTGYGTVDVAVEAMKSGATDFLMKPFGRERLLSAIDDAAPTPLSHTLGISGASAKTGQLSVAELSRQRRQNAIILVQANALRADILANYEIAEAALKIRSASNSQAGLRELATDLNVKKKTADRYANVAARWPRRNMDRLLARVGADGLPVRWGHLVHIANSPREREQELLERAWQGASVRQLRGLHSGARGD